MSTKAESAAKNMSAPDTGERKERQVPDNLASLPPKPRLWAVLQISTTTVASTEARASTYEYAGPSVRGYKCDPKKLPTCPNAQERGMPAARFVSEPGLCATTIIGMMINQQYSLVPDVER